MDIQKYVKCMLKMLPSLYKEKFPIETLKAKLEQEYNGIDSDDYISRHVWIFIRKEIFTVSEWRKAKKYFKA